MFLVEWGGWWLIAIVAILSRVMKGDPAEMVSFEQRPRRREG